MGKKNVTPKELLRTALDLSGETHTAEEDNTIDLILLALTILIKRWD